jgi:hypothetical protein
MWLIMEKDSSKINWDDGQRVKMPQYFFNLFLGNKIFFASVKPSVPAALQDGRRPL